MVLALLVMPLITHSDVESSDNGVWGQTEPKARKKEKQQLTVAAGVAVTLLCVLLQLTATCCVAIALLPVVPWLHCWCWCRGSLSPSCSWCCCWHYRRIAAGAGGSPWHGGGLHNLLSEKKQKKQRDLPMIMLECHVVSCHITVGAGMSLWYKRSWYAGRQGG